MAGKGSAIGIDLGTMYSCVGVWKPNGGGVEIIANEKGTLTTPSCVAFTETHRLFGDEAMNQLSRNMSNTVYDAKRLIGRRFTDSVVQKDIPFWPFQVISDSNDKPMIAVNYMREQKNFYPEEISSMVLSKMKHIAEAYLQSTVKNAVVTVPAYFNASQRQATIDACAIAGLNVLRLLNEPTAAAMAYDLQNNSTSGKRVLVVDLGGGTLDVSLVTIGNGLFTVEATAGNQHLGGQDFVKTMVDHFLKELKNTYKNNQHVRAASPKAIRRLKTACEDAKRTLSTAMTAYINLEALFEGVDLCTSITRAKFEKLNTRHFAECMKTVDKCLRSAKIKINQVDDVVLVGGSTRIPKIQLLLQELFKGKKQLCQNINPDLAIAYGAAFQAAILNGDQNVPNAVLTEVTPLPLGYKSAIKDEVTGRIRRDVMNVVVPKNSPVPITKKLELTTVRDNQREMVFSIYEGEGESIEGNTYLGELELLGIPHAKEGVPSITLCFDVHLDGTLIVSAEERSSGKRNSVTIPSFKGGFSREEIQKMVEQAVKYKCEDDKHNKKLEAINASLEYASNMKNSINPEWSAHAKEKFECHVDLTIQWLEECHLEDVDDIECKMKELDEMYQSVAAIDEDGLTASVAAIDEDGPTAGGGIGAGSKAAIDEEGPTAGDGIGAGSKIN